MATLPEESKGSRLMASDCCWWEDVFSELKDIEAIGCGGVFVVMQNEGDDTAVVKTNRT